MNEYVNLTLDNLESEHLCCAISDKKHQYGVSAKKAWLKERIGEGHVFRKLNAQGKIFIEYAPLDKAWVPVIGDNYMYIYCMWVAGSYKSKGYGEELLNYAIDDAKKQSKSGICMISSKKKQPFLSDKKFLEKYGFKVVDSIGSDYELMSLSFDGKEPSFTDKAKLQEIDSKDLTIYYGMQCPYIPNCIGQIEKYCNENNIKVDLIKVDILEKAKDMPCMFNNWAVFNDGKFVTHHLLNESLLKKLLNK